MQKMSTEPPAVEVDIPNDLSGNMDQQATKDEPKNS